VYALSLRMLERNKFKIKNHQCCIFGADKNPDINHSRTEYWFTRPYHCFLLYLSSFSFFSSFFFYFIYCLSLSSYSYLSFLFPSFFVLFSSFFISFIHSFFFSHVSMQVICLRMVCSLNHCTRQWCHPSETSTYTGRVV